MRENEVPATCTQAGSYEEAVYCTVCGEEISRESKVVEALGHTEEILPGKEPTCTEAGLTEGKKCSVCDEILAAQTEIAAKGHSYTFKWVFNEDFTEKTKVYTCSACQHSYSDAPIPVE